MLPAIEKIDTSIPPWKVFSFPHGTYLLHTPTSHVIRYHGRDLPSADHPSLQGLAATFPKPKIFQSQIHITSAALNLAQGCNLSCSYCFAGEGDYGSKKIMTLDVATRALRVLAEGKTHFHIAFFGGEPLLNFKTLKEIVEWTKSEPQKYSFSITTNGTLLTEEKLRFLKDHKFSMNLSYDGRGLGEHQRFAKEKNQFSPTDLILKKVISFADGLNALKDFRLRGTVTKENLNYLKHAVLDTLTSTNFKVFLSHHGTEDRAREFNEDAADTYAGIMRDVHDLLLQEKDFQRLFRIERLVENMRKFLRGKTGGMTCGAGLSYVSVSASGEFFLCHRFTEDASEKVGDMELGLNLEKLEQIRAYRQDPSPSCHACWMKEWCRGGCFHEHKAKNGDTLLINPVFCYLQDLELKEAMRVYTYLLEYEPHALETIK